MIGFDINELKHLIEEKFLYDLSSELYQKGINITDLQINSACTKEIVDKLVYNNTKKKEYIEIFTAWILSMEFYGGDSKIFFILKPGIQPEKANIKTIDDLKKATQEDDLTDFTILNIDGARQFQLKQYPFELETEKLSDFINKKMEKYGNNIGEVNLLILLQGKENKSFIQNINIDFETLYKNLSQKKFNFTGQILIYYNELNNKLVVNQVYPNLTTSQRDIDLKILYKNPLSPT